MNWPRWKLGGGGGRGKGGGREGPGRGREGQGRRGGQRRGAAADPRRGGFPLEEGKGGGGTPLSPPLPRRSQERRGTRTREGASRTAPEWVPALGARSFAAAAAASSSSSALTVDSSSAQLHFPGCNTSVTPLFQDLANAPSTFMLDCEPPMCRSGGINTRRRACARACFSPCALRDTGRATVQSRLVRVSKEPAHSEGERQGHGPSIRARRKHVCHGRPRVRRP
ncbi:translation initiation factor IF-2-like [Cricetulus griseus]|uniref:Translation initiation factor IF-2-like n=1 Tax=Cricetulus griseus TaxID=10029 RepID=A0A9J7KB31_CRIGR|nr:translation initiation factor IF-2-like [Cricetulus griseus]